MCVIMHECVYVCICWFVHSIYTYIDIYCTFCHWVLHRVLPQLANFLLATLVLLVHLIAKPFKEEHNNIIEAAVLLNFVLVTICYLEAPVGMFATVMVILVTVLPYLYAVGYLVVLFARKM